VDLNPFVFDLTDEFVGIFFAMKAVHMLACAVLAHVIDVGDLNPKAPPTLVVNLSDLDGGFGRGSSVYRFVLPPLLIKLPHAERSNRAGNDPEHLEELD